VKSRHPDSHPVGAPLRSSGAPPLLGNAKRLRELVAELEALSARTIDQAEGWPQA
jgi:hypothetical protein